MLNKKRLFIVFLIIIVLGFTLNTTYAKTYNFHGKEINGNAEYWGENSKMAVNTFYTHHKCIVSVTSKIKVKYLRYYYYKGYNLKVKKLSLKQPRPRYSGAWNGKVRDYEKTVKCKPYHYPVKISVVV